MRDGRRVGVPRIGVVVAALVTALVAVFAVARAVASDNHTTSTAAAPSTTAGSGPAAAVSIKDFTFSPRAVTVKVGTQVTWTNGDPFAHSIKSADGTFNSSPLDQGKTFQAVFSKAGTFAYICGIHNSMTGMVIVTP
jgi:plastocyanin